MKIKDLRNLRSEDLKGKLKEFQEELMKLRFQGVASQIKNPVKKRELRHSVARIKTLLKEESSGGQKIKA